MTTLEDEAKIEREQGKLARNMIACLRPLYVNSVKEILPFPQKIFGQPGIADMRVIVKNWRLVFFLLNPHSPCFLFLWWFEMCAILLLLGPSWTSSKNWICRKFIENWYLILLILWYFWYFLILFDTFNAIYFDTLDSFL